MCLFCKCCANCDLLHTVAPINIQNIKHCFRGKIHSGFEDWRFPFTRTLENLMIFFRHFIGLWTLDLDDENIYSLLYLLSPDIQSSISWQKKKSQQILRNPCKEETSIYKSIVDSVIKKSFLCFYILSQFTIFTRRKVFSPSVTYKNILE